MSIVQLTSSQRRKLQAQLRRAQQASHYRRLLAVLGGGDTRYRNNRPLPKARSNYAPIGFLSALSPSPP